VAPRGNDEGDHGAAWAIGDRDGKRRGITAHQGAAGEPKGAEPMGASAGRLIGRRDGGDPYHANVRETAAQRGRHCGWTRRSREQQRDTATLGRHSVATNLRPPVGCELFGKAGSTTVPAGTHAMPQSPPVCLRVCWVSSGMVTGWALSLPSIFWSARELSSFPPLDSYAGAAKNQSIMTSWGDDSWAAGDTAAAPACLVMGVAHPQVLCLPPFVLCCTMLGEGSPMIIRSGGCASLGVDGFPEGVPGDLALVPERPPGAMRLPQCRLGRAASGASECPTVLRSPRAH
jgi:hypothetical protein